MIILLINDHNKFQIQFIHQTINLIFFYTNNFIFLSDQSQNKFINKYLIDIIFFYILSKDFINI